MNGMFFDPEGNPISVFEWSDLRREMEEDRSKWVVGKTKVADSEVSTVWVGLNMGLFWSRPIIFETLVFGEYFDGISNRYSTWEEAARGHEIIVSKLKAGVN